MVRLPRVAIGSVQPGCDAQFMSWALMEMLTRGGTQVQHFVSRCSFGGINGAITATGLSSRHLDSWLMSADACRECLVRATGESELALVEGQYDVARGETSGGGSLDCLCEWLDLPRLVVLDRTRLDACCLPPRPQADALLLDRISGPADLYALQTALESLWGIPVVGALEEMPRLREAVAAVDKGTVLPRELCEQLGSAIARYTRPEAIRRLAERRPLADVSTASIAPEPAAAITVAVAYDDAFHCYFPDTLDLLELMGATVVDFSPLRDESLPPGADLVYVGCGHPERFAAALSENHCMMSALRNHLCAGRRIYADGGGLSYLCQYLEAVDGSWVSMVGVLPAVARRNRAPDPPCPVELTLAHDTWLAEAGTPLRGYLNTAWVLEQRSALTGLLRERDHEYDLVGRYQALGSRMQVNFATQPAFLHNFLKPVVPRLALGSLDVPAS
jgi:cobyrinic acid a,c-diamide synthase